MNDKVYKIQMLFNIYILVSTYSIIWLIVLNSVLILMNLKSYLFLIPILPIYLLFNFKIKVSRPYLIIV